MSKRQIYIDFIINEIEKGNIQHKDACSAFLQNFACTRQTFDKYWKLAQKDYSERLETIKNIKQAKTLKKEIEAAKKQIKTKIKLIEDLEAEILQIEETLKDGYIVKQLNINGEIVKHKEIFGSREFDIWNRMLKDKREMLIKLQGFEASKKVETYINGGTEIVIKGNKFNNEINSLEQ